MESLLGFLWGRVERFLGLFFGEWGKVESLLGLFVWEWGRVGVECGLPSTPFLHTRVTTLRDDFIQHKSYVMCQNSSQLGFLYLHKRAKRSYCILGMDLHVIYSVTKRNKNNNTYKLARMHLGQSL